MTSKQDILNDLISNKYDIDPKYVEEITNLFKQESTTINNENRHTIDVEYYIDSPILDGCFSREREAWIVNYYVVFSVYPMANSNIPKYLSVRKNFIIDNQIKDNHELVKNPRFIKMLKDNPDVLRTSSVFFQDYLLL